MKLLEAEGVYKKFGGIDALRDVGLDAEPGEIVGVIGPNGAGKTTLFNCLLGMEKPDRGRISFEGIDLVPMPMHRRARLGIGRTFQRMELFAEMTGREHLLAAERSQAGGSLARDLINKGQPKADERERAAEILSLLGLTAIADRPVESLSLGHSRLVELGRALATRPRLLMLDEPSSGLDRAETAELAEVLQRVVAARGMAVLLVEHDLELVRQITTRLFVLDVGRLLISGPTSDVLDDSMVREAYIGRTEQTGPARTRPRQQEEPRAEPVPPLLELDNVHASYGPFRALFGVSLEVPPRSAVALLGPNGAGKSTVARVATGVVPLASGRVLFDGVDVSEMRPHRRTKLGLVHVPEGRSVFAKLTVEENLSLQFGRTRDKGDVASALEHAFQAFPQLARRRHQRAKTLSGGEQRMLALAPIIVDAPRLLIVDELSLGLAPILIDEVYRTLAEIRDAGTSILIVEQQVAQAFSLADSFVLLGKGEVVTAGDADDVAAVSSYLSGETPDGL
jgi:ABC-type branched-subunit amino acid transport system ATPase component